MTPPVHPVEAFLPTTLSHSVSHFPGLLRWTLSGPAKGTFSPDGRGVWRGTFSDAPTAAPWASSWTWCYSSPVVLRLENFLDHRKKKPPQSSDYRKGISHKDGGDLNLFWPVRRPFPLAVTLKHTNSRKRFFPCQLVS